jgi:hypothetical protein
MLLALCLALLFSLLLSGSLVAQARGLVPVAQPGGPHGKSIDWAHPVQTYPVHSHSGHQGDLPADTVPLYVPPKAGLAVRPNANFPSNCLNNYAYYVIVNGQTSWTAQAGNQKAQVWYMWCPRWQGDSVGLNWSYGKLYQLSGCSTISVGGPTGNEVGGAFLLYHGSWPAWASDGEQVTGYYTCAGGLVWDDSLTLPGDGLYMAEIADNQVYVTSPCYC